MPDHEFENWLQEQIPAETSLDVDARILAAGEQCLSAKRPTSGRTWRRAAIAATLLLAGLGSWIFILFFPLERIADEETRLAAAGGGSFVVAADSRYVHTFHSSQLQLIEGQSTVEAADEPLEVFSPAGTLRVARGRGEIQVSKESEKMKKNEDGRSWKKGTVAVAVTLLVGWGVLEYGDQIEELRAGEAQTLIAEPSPGAPSGWEVTGDGESEGGIPSTEAGEASEAAAESDQPDPATMFHGRVVDAETGKPVAGARVGWVDMWLSPAVSMATALHLDSTRAVSFGDPLSIKVGEVRPRFPYQEHESTSLRIETVTDADGAYTLPRKQQGDQFLRVGAEGYQNWFEAEPSSVERDDVVVSRLDKSRTLKGRITALDGSLPIGEAAWADCSLVFKEPGLADWTFEWKLSLNEDFSFELPVGLLSSTSLRVSAMGYKETQYEVELEPGVNDVLIRLEGRPHIHGRVVDEQGAPVHGASLMVKSRKKRLMFRSGYDAVQVLTNSEGEYVANISGTDIEISIEGEGFAPRKISKNPSDPTQPIDIVLTRASTGGLSGGVVDSSGASWAGAEVRATLEAISSSRSHRCVTDDEGQFELTSLPPGVYTLFVQPLPQTKDENNIYHFPVGRAHVLIKRTGVEVRSGQEQSGIEIVTPRAGEVRGVYRDQDGELVSGEQIALYKPDMLGGNHKRLARLQTDDKGEFRFLGVPHGTLAVAIVRSEKYSLVKVSKNSVVEVELGGETSSVSARVFQDGEPLSGIDVGIGRIQETVTDARLTQTDEDGSVHFDGLSRGRYLLHAKNRGTSQTMLSIFELDRTELNAEFDWPTTTVTVQVTGEPLGAGATLKLTAIEVAGVRVAGVVPAQYLQVGVAASDDGVSYRFGGVAPGRYQIESVDAARSISQQVEVKTYNVRVDIE